MDYLESGSLFKLRTKVKSFNEKMTAWFMYQLLLIFSYLQKFPDDTKIIHRDIKVENILIKRSKDASMKMVLIDFGNCNYICPDKEKRDTFCGTLEYLAPEMILNRGHTEKTDIWSAGVVMYELLLGKTPFVSTNNTDENYNAETCVSILKKDLFMSELPISDLCKDILQKMLIKQDKKRWTVDMLLDHPWFKKKLKEQDLNQIRNYKILPDPKVNDLKTILGLQREVITNKKKFSVLDNKNSYTLKSVDNEVKKVVNSFNDTIIVNNLKNKECSNASVVSEACLHKTLFSGSNVQDKKSLQKTNDTEISDINKFGDTEKNLKEDENLEKIMQSFYDNSGLNSCHNEPPWESKKTMTKKEQKIANYYPRKKQSKSSFILNDSTTFESFRNKTLNNTTGNNVSDLNREELEKINKERFSTIIGKEKQVLKNEPGCCSNHSKKGNKSSKTGCAVF